MHCFEGGNSQLITFLYAPRTEYAPSPADHLGRPKWKPVGPGCLFWLVQAITKLPKKGLEELLYRAFQVPFVPFLRTSFS
jgi:hypothetical protein